MSGDGLLSNAKLFELSPEHVDEGNRIGFLHEAMAAALGRTMAVFGQRDPIKVVANPKNPDKPWRLVTGMHRLICARIEGIPVHAIEVTGKPEELADLEASENLHRRPLGPIERAMFVHSLANAAQERIAREHGTLRQQQLAIKARWDRVKAGETTAEQALTDEADDTVDKMSTVCGWREDAAEALGLGRKEIQRALTLYRMLVEPFPELTERLAKHPTIGENASALRQIAQVKDQAHRRAVIERLLDDEETTLETAMAGLGIAKRTGPAPTADQKFISTAMDSLNRLSASAQKQHIDSIITVLKSDEVKRQLRDRLNEELGDA